MANYNIPFFSLDSASSNINGLMEFFPSGAQWDWFSWASPTLTMNDATTIHTAQIFDTGNTMLDDDPGASGQTLGADILDGDGNVLWAAGSAVEDEYEITLSDADGTEYRLAAISIDGTIIGFTFEGDVPPAGTELTYCPGNYSDYETLDPSAVVICFAHATQIATSQGDKRAIDLAVGDRVLTRDNGFQPLRWVGARAVATHELRQAPHLRPIRIAAGALGPGLPRKDLVVSPQHRILVKSRIAERMFGTAEVLVAAKHLTAIPGIDVDNSCGRVTYVHLLFDDHQIVFANGAPAESLFSGPEAARALETGLFDINDIPAAKNLHELVQAPARLLVPGRRGRKLAERHARNGKNMFEMALAGIWAAPPNRLPDHPNGKTRGVPDNGPLPHHAPCA